MLYNPTYIVCLQLTIRQFKERIASSVGVAAESQRLISSGKVLQDDKRLQEYGDTAFISLLANHDMLLPYGYCCCCHSLNLLSIIFPLHLSTPWCF